jgi:hypothetical protein
MGNGIGGFGAATFRLAVSGSLDVEPCTELSGRRGINAARGMSDKRKFSIHFATVRNAYTAVD